jgi:hypothetical protein
VIGIFIALQLNNWNQNRIDNLQATEALYNLKAELQKNIIDLEKSDSLYAEREASTAKGIEMINKAFCLKDLITIDTLIKTTYTIFPITKSTYLELLNTGNFYNIKNEQLKSEINKLYLDGDRKTSAFLEINGNTQQAMLNPELFKYNYTIEQLNSKTPQIQLIDTLWIYNKNSSTFLALHNKARMFQTASNKIRRNLITQHINMTKKLILSIDKELNIHSN